LNQGRFIRTAIESVLSQDYPAIEYIVMDGGSTDETAEVVREYADRIRFVSEHDRGQSHAINKGWRLGRGEIVSWLCADDLLLPGAVSTVVAEFARRPETGLVYGECESVDANGNFLALTDAGAPDAWGLIHGYDYIPQPAAFARRSVVESVGFVDEGLHWGMDWDLFIRIAKAATMTHVPRPLARVRTYDQTKTLSGGRRRFRELVGIMRKHGSMRYPPAYFYYGLGTVQHSIRQHVSRQSGALAMPMRWAGRAIDTACEIGLERAVTAARRGWHPDGWASPIVDIDLPAGVTLLHLRGRVPGEYAALRGQVLTLSVGAAKVGRFHVGTGEFAIDVPVPPAPVAEATRRLRVRAARHFVPRRSRINGDRRRLCYYLDEIRTEPGGEGSIDRRVAHMS
jgi:hypothetical protein